MRSVAPLSILFCATLAFAGCVDDVPGTGAGEEEPEIVIEEGLRIEAKNCIQGGGNSVYPMSLFGDTVGPFKARDQRPEVGDPVIGAYGMPLTEPSNGIWHVATKCETYTYKGQEYKDFGMGWIAQLIMPPAEVQTDTTPRLDFFVADLSFNVPEYVALTSELTGGAEISEGHEYIVEWMVPMQKYMHVVLTEANHGTFDFTSEIHKEFGPKTDEHIRFWQLAAVGGGGGHGHGEEESSPVPQSRAGADTPMYRPIYFDVYHTQREGPTMKLAGESAGTFTHFPDGHVGNPLGHYWHGFDMVVELGPIPQGVLYDETWLH